MRTRKDSRHSCQALPASPGDCRQPFYGSVNGLLCGFCGESLLVGVYESNVRQAHEPKNLLEVGYLEVHRSYR